MSNDQVLMPSGVSQSFDANLPPQQYACRIKSAERHTPADPTKAANVNIKLKCEIMAPDIVTDPLTGGQVKASGRSFDIYVSAAPHMRNFEDSFATLGKLGLLMPEGGFTIDHVVRLASKGDVFFMCLIITEPEFYTTKDMNGNDVPVMIEGKPYLKGFRIKLPDAKQIGQRIPTPPGFVPPAF